MNNPNININVGGPQKVSSTYETVILKGNKSFASQVTKPNMKYVIKYDFDLNGATVNIPAGCLIEFDGGSISNGTLVGNKTVLIYNQPLNEILTAILNGTWTDYKVEVDERIAEAKSEIIGDAASDYNTLGKLEDKIKEEAERAQAAEVLKANAADVYTKTETYNKTELNNMITTPNQEYVTVIATSQTTSVTDVLPATGAADTVYRVGNWDGTQYSEVDYTEYAWNGSVYIKLDTKSQIGEVYDISANHADTKYADLSAALGTNGANIPQSLRKGGMSVKFVQNSDNTYVQARCMAQNFTTDVTQWQGVSFDSSVFEEPNNAKKIQIPSVGAVSKVFGKYISSKSFIQVLVDLDNRFLNGTTKDGKSVVNTLLALYNIYASEIFANVFKTEAYSTFIISNKEFLLAIVDLDYRVFFGIKRNGKIVSLGNGTVNRKEFDDFKDETNSSISSLKETDLQIYNILDTPIEKEQLSETLWNQIVVAGGGTVHNSADGEDLENTEQNTIKFKGKVYNPEQNSGLGRYFARKNDSIADLLENNPNTRIIIQYNHTISSDIHIANNVILDFQGGKIEAADDVKIYGNFTKIIAEPYQIFNTKVSLDGIWNVEIGYAEWWGAKADNETDCTDAFNIACGDSGFSKVQTLNGIYCVSGSIWIRKTRLELPNYSTIKATDDIGTLIIISAGTSYSLGYNKELIGISGGGTIDCNKKAEVGIAVNYGNRIHIHDIAIYNPLLCGIQNKYQDATGTSPRVDIDHVVISNHRDEELLTIEDNVIGIHINHGDSTISDCEIIDCPIGVKLSSADVVLTNIHCWVNTLPLFINSTQFLCDGGDGVYMFSNCHADTMRNYLKSTSGESVFVITQPTMQCNNSVIDNNALTQYPIKVFAKDANDILSAINGYVYPSCGNYTIIDNNDKNIRDNYDFI